MLATSGYGEAAAVLVGSLVSLNWLLRPFGIREPKLKETPVVIWVRRFGAGYATELE